MFAHLHLHSEYSLLDGACRMTKTLDKVKAMGMTACAITDHGVLYGAVDFYREAKKRGIHPVIGCEMYVCSDMDEKSSAAREYSHLVLLCQNMTGYKNLSRLVSEGFTRGFYYKPRVDYELLRKYSDGLIASSACISGDIPKLLLNGDYDAATRMAQMYSEIYPGRFYIELMDHGMPDEKRLSPRLIELARENHLPMIVTNDAHYIDKDDALAQDVLMCIQTGKTLSDTQRMKMDTQELYVKSEQEMSALFPHAIEAIENTQRVAESCHVEFDFDTLHLPKYPLPEGESPDALLRKLCEAGMTKKYGDRADAQKRMEYELSVISSMGYSDYFLIVWDFVNYAKTHGILVGPGRGSGAGSIVAFALDITGIDPLAYALLFERFLNPERVSMPDFDIDFCYENRQKVIDYVANKYGVDHVAQIITFGTMAAKAVIRDVGRVLGMPYGQVDRIAKLVPFALDMTLTKALEQVLELREMTAEDGEAKQLMELSLKLEGMPRHASTHAAGVLITQMPVSEYVPLQTNDNVITTQYPMGTLEALGLLKMDFLGLRTLTVINDALNMLRTRGINIIQDDIPLDDPEVLKMVAQGDTDGVFQLESGGMRACLMGMKPNCFEDIIAAISLYRPGPMDSIPRYVKGKHNPETVTYLHPLLKPILDVTYGCMVYQEQVMQIVRDVAGYSLGRSDLVRRAMSKKKHDVMAKESAYFVQGAMEHGVPEAVALKIFDEMSSFASYAFNKSHAAAYGVIAMHTAYLKKYYTAEFMAALMNSLQGNTDKIAAYIHFCRSRGITVHGPDVNLSGIRFSVDDGAIRFGLSAIKNVGATGVNGIVREAKEGGAYKNIYDFCDRTREENLGRRAVECLIRAGALDSLPGTRAQLLAVLGGILGGVSGQKKRQVSGQLSLFDMADDLAPEPPKLPNIPPFTPRESLAMEKEMTGIYITGHPLNEYADVLKNARFNTQFVTNLTDMHGAGSYDDMRLELSGIITERHTKLTKKGDLMGFATLEDFQGQIEVLIFPKTYEKCGHMVQIDEMLTLSGRLSLREDEAPKLILESLAPL